MLLGKVLASMGMLRGLNVTWMPSYGAEVRGGTAHSMVRISSKPIASPVVSDTSAAIIMNSPSLDKFEERIVPGGLLILNASMASRKVERDDIDIIAAPLTDEAIKLGNVRVANMIAAGIFTARKKIFDKKVLVSVIEEIAAGHKALLPINIRAVEKGISLVRGEEK